MLTETLTFVTYIRRLRCLLNGNSTLAFLDSEAWLSRLLCRARLALVILMSNASVLLIRIAVAAGDVVEYVVSVVARVVVVTVWIPTGLSFYWVVSG